LNTRSNAFDSSPFFSLLTVTIKSDRIKKGNIAGITEKAQSLIPEIMYERISAEAINVISINADVAMIIRTL
jgi:hypothetical protein